MDGFWAVFWLALVLKIPIVMLLCLVWYAIRAEPELEPDEPGRGGSDRHPPKLPRHPRPPRRGPHAEPPPRSPARVRVARSRRIRSH
ncbi:MAG TPA: hypothetical protein VGF21_08775 [Thermoleophilaceae bacterium]